MSAPSTSWKEIIPPGEAERLLRHAEALRDLQERNVREGVVRRALHAKGLGGLEMEFQVLPRVPEFARVGLFAKPATYRGYARFSNGSGVVQSDRTPDVRGLALKLVGVPGRKVLPGLEDARTQDFSLIRNSSTPFRDADEFVTFVLAAESPVTMLPVLFKRFGLIGTGRILGRLIRTARDSAQPLATARFFSALPIKLGPYAVRYALSPTGSWGGATHARDLGAELAEHLKREPASWEFQVQFFQHEARTPIEDASVEWDPMQAPYLTLARVTLPKQDVNSTRGRRISEFVEKLSFDPWHATEDLRPLGNMMRARREAYRLSAMRRNAAPEPDGSERFD